MRLDKFLKVSRLIKRRTLAKEIADQGRILVNNNVAKAATTIAVGGDELKIQFGQKLLTIQIDRLKETVKKDEASELYTIKHEEYIKQ
ncbi:ribosome-associated heat shock protein implicated in the recycling of the 50S subunit [Gracilibacillus boraciitolerans JCM 21714]|uniref:RQC P-site tRNA stabilizing factor n=1 Tax=Gracilibacillus boraciitolerans JCM 21714 TaxID=1298598 RepID=W4VN72_9BACI|nr:RNA-binding S4 domain-containing protein [Gracilibacillus boraciitolerans]GAE94199.1 ribosome-associated heat shock protein implicated in the recycling of the 50S subunit [Gracilibacillus boraciitolerans JCM 21714]